MEVKATDYAFSTEAASDLAGVVQFPHDIRLEVLQSMQKKIGSDAMLALFSQFIGMANSVVANSHEALEVFLIIEKGWYPYQAEKLNFPSSLVL